MSKGNNDKKWNLQQLRHLAVPTAKIILPAAALVIVIATIITLIQSKRIKESETAATFTEATTESVAAVDVLSEPLEENAYPAVNEFATSFYQALANGDMDTVLALRDYTSDKERLTYEKKSEYIESYNNITCYTKDALEEGSYYLYVYYEVKFKNIDTLVPGLNTFYVYTNDEGQLRIDGNMEESVTAALKLVTNQDDVKDLFNKVNVSYKEAVAGDEALNTLLTELPGEIKTSVGVALAALEQETTASTEEAQEETTEQAETTTQETTETAATADAEEQLENQTVNQQVRANDTVNVRSSDSSEADRLGKAQQGEILTRTEIRVNGWSKVEFEGKEAFIKSEYLEVVSDDTVTDTQTDTTASDSASTRSVTATTNVNVRNAASQDADKIGSAKENATYTVLEELGEWLKIDYNGQTGYVKAEYFK